MDVPRVAPCVPGAGEVVPRTDETYEGALRVQLGPVRLNLRGTIVWEQRDAGRSEGRFRAEARDRSVRGGLQAAVRFSLSESGADSTELLLTTDVTFLGKLGEFGHAVIARKADALLTEFALNVQRALQTDVSVGRAPTFDSS